MLKSSPTWVGGHQKAKRRFQSLTCLLIRPDGLFQSRQRRSIRNAELAKPPFCRKAKRSMFTKSTQKTCINGSNGQLLYSRIQTFRYCVIFFLIRRLLIRKHFIWHTKMCGLLLPRRFLPPVTWRKVHARVCHNPGFTHYYHRPSFPTRTRWFKVNMAQNLRDPRLTASVGVVWTNIAANAGRLLDAWLSLSASSFGKFS